MNETKSKFPDFKELASMTGKLYNDIKVSVTQIIQDYKENRAKADVDEQGKSAQAHAQPKKNKKSSESTPEDK